ncbi:MAG TPA: prephenate dehydratase [Actinomycetales bacterium]|jgi:prephenate dehydratase
MRFAYLGPSGTFTESAVLQVASPDDELSPMASVDAALEAVRDGSADRAVVPIENSVEGGVPQTLDSLGSGSALMVVREMLVPITFVLAARAGTGLDDVRRVSSHPHGWAQCRGWVGAQLPGATYVPALSTAASAQGLASDDEVPYEAALCSALAAERFGLTVLAEGVGDNASAVTRFVLVSRPGPLGPPSGADKTSVVVFQNDDHPGGLLELLEQFATRGINLTRIESRPTGDALGRYCFSIDCEGHLSQARVAEALMGLHRTCSQVRFLGSYPRADGVQGTVTASTSEPAFERARVWVEALREGRPTP